MQCKCSDLRGHLVQNDHISGGHLPYNWEVHSNGSVIAPAAFKRRGPAQIIKNYQNVTAAHGSEGYGTIYEFLHPT